MSNLELVYLCRWTPQNLDVSVHNNSQCVLFLSYPGWAICNMHNVPVANGSTRIAQVVHDLLAVSHSTQLVGTTLQQARLLPCGLVSCVNDVQIVWTCLIFTNVPDLRVLFDWPFLRERYILCNRCVLCEELFNPLCMGQSWHPEIRSFPFSQLGQGFLNVNFILHM